MNRKKEEDKKVHLSIQMNEKLNEYLDEFTENNGLKKSQLIEDLLRKYLNSKSIKFPTEEEIYQAGSIRSNDDWWDGFYDGCKWVIEFIKNNN